MSKIKLFGIIFLLFVLGLTAVSIFIRNLEHRIRNEDSSPSMRVIVNSVNNNQDHVKIRMSTYVKMGMLEINYRVGGNQEISILRNGQFSVIPLEDIGWSVTPFNESYIPSIAFEKALLVGDKSNSNIIKTTISTSSFKEIYSWLPVFQEKRVVFGGLPPTIPEMIKEGLTKIALFGKVVVMRLTNQKALQSDWLGPLGIITDENIIVIQPILYVPSKNAIRLYNTVEFDVYYSSE